MNPVKNIYRKLRTVYTQLNNKKTLEKGVRHFEATGETETSAYIAMRSLFVQTRGRSNDELSDKIRTKSGTYPDPSSYKGVLGSLSTEEISGAVSSLNENGFVVFNTFLDDKRIGEIIEFAKNEPSPYLNIESNSMTGEDDKLVFDPINPVSVKYQFDTSSILKSNALQSLIFDESLMFFAQKYLGCKPIQDLVACWWSAPFNGKGLSEAAQMYHFDLDRIKFLKFFFYLTDVTSETGPHCYVKGSQKTLPEAINRDGRFTDQEIAATYGKENLLEIGGRKGSILAVDTRGFHKGKELTKGCRLIFQIEFANSMFGQSYPPARISFTSAYHKEMFEKYPSTYGSIFYTGISG